jgi:hypothetical protein
MKILFINGAEIVTVSKLMGLNSSKITDIYTHVSTKNIYHIKSPFDDLKNIYLQNAILLHIYYYRIYNWRRKVSSIRELYASNEKTYRLNNN